MTVIDNPRESVEREELWVSEPTPAQSIRVLTYNDGRKLVSHYLNDKLHREDEPAELSLDAKGRVIREDWYFDDLPHRDDGPATTEYDEGTGTLKHVSFWEHGWLHRLDGPADILFAPNGDATYLKFYHHGEEVAPFPTEDDDLTL